MKHLPALLIGFLAGAAVMYVVFAFTPRRTPPTPELQPPTAIKVTLYPWHGMEGIDGKPVDIPSEKLDFVFRRLTPKTYFEGGVNDLITPIMAEALIIHADGKETTVLVRDHGKNPAVVTVDGRNYFYARNDPDVSVGASQLFGLVSELAEKKKAMQP